VLRTHRVSSRRGLRPAPGSPGSRRPERRRPQILAGGFHGLSFELPKEKACYQH
jgi:hypothetical protein